MIKTELFPLHKADIVKDFGYISYQLILANVDVIGIRILKSFEVVVITFLKSQKTGFIYEGGNLSAEQVFRVFQDVPEDRNNLSEYEKNLAGKVEVLLPPKHNYVFVSDTIVTPLNKK